MRLKINKKTATKKKDDKRGEETDIQAEKIAPSSLFIIIPLMDFVCE